mgnify:CR=1 FL=1
MIRLLYRITLLATLLLSVACCKREVTNIDEIDIRSERGLAGSQDHLSRAISTLERSDQFDPSEAHSKVISQLSQWIESQPPVDDWLVDPLQKTIPDKFRWVFRYAPLDRMQFVTTDVNVLREAIWLRQIANYQMEMLRKQSPDAFIRVDDLQTNLRKLQGEGERLEAQLKLEDDAAAKATLEEQNQVNRQQQAQTTTDLSEAENDLALLKASWLFDWTIRNIRLKQTHWDARLPDSEAQSDQSLVPPPGAEYQVWQSLLLGQGDAVQRARVFLLLCRQVSIDVVVLGVDSTNDQPPREWVAAVVIGDQLYLFDADLGIAIPGPAGKEHGTLADLRAHPELLRALDTAEFPYPVQGKDLERLAPLVDATLEALSQRMMLVEQSLPKEHRVILTAAPSAQARQLRKHNLANAEIWLAPYRGYRYDELRRRDPKVAGPYYTALSAFNPPLELYAGRLHHFRGQISEPSDELLSSASDPTQSNVPQAAQYKHGAKYYYLECRSPEGEIDAIQEELEAWFAQDPTKTRRELLVQLASDLYALDVFEERRNSLQAGEIDPAEQFYRQQQEAEAMKRDPEAAAKLRRGERELMPEEVEQLQQIESRLKVLSPTTRSWIKRLQLQRQNVVALTDDRREDFIEQFKEVTSRVKEHATWWLAITTMEEGDLGVAENFLEQRFADGSEEVWGDYANCQLGRLYELAGQHEQAIEFYQADQSPQRAGSLVRAKLLAEAYAAPDE